MRRAIDSATAKVGLVIDRDYGKDRHRGASARALLIVNASDIDFVGDPQHRAGILRHADSVGLLGPALARLHL